MGVGEQVVAVDEHGVAPLVGEMERELREFDGFGDVERREHDVAVVAVAAAAGRLEVVLLAARHVEDDERQLGERDLAERLLHEREALAGRAGGGAGAGRERTPRHADGLELALGVDAHAAHLGQLLGEVLEELGERRHRVAGEEAAAGRDRGFRHRLGALHEAPIGGGDGRHDASSATSGDVGHDGLVEAEHLEAEVGTHHAGRPRSRCSRGAAAGSGSRGG